MSLINDNQVIQKVVETEIVGPLDETTGGLPVHIVSPLESNGAMPVNIQDQHTKAFDLFFSRNVGVPSSLILDTVEDEYTIEAATGHGFTALSDLVMADPVTQRGFTAEVVSVVGPNTINLDRPLVAVFPAATTILQQRSHNLAVDGSVTPVVFEVGGSPTLTAELDITRLMLQMTCEDPVLWNTFGDQPTLPRGVLCRIVNGVTHNLWNAKSNSQLKHLMFDLDFFDVTKQTVNGIAGRLTYAGPSKHGVTLRIGQFEAVQIIVQDDLRGLLSFGVIAGGHIVTD